jgi:hypothetical protein
MNTFCSVFLLASATCRYRLQRPSNSKGDDDPLFTLPVLGPTGDNTYVRYVPVNKTCTIVAANATFLKCDGTWGQLTESKVNNKLAFTTTLPGTVYVGPVSEVFCPCLNKWLAIKI